MRERFAPWLRVCVAAAASVWTAGCVSNARPTRLLVDANPVAVEVEGRGTVRSPKVGVNCRETGGVCRGENFTLAGSELIAEADPGWKFVRWETVLPGQERYSSNGNLYRAVFERTNANEHQVNVALSGSPTD